MVRVPGLLRSVLSQVPTVIVLAALGLLAWWGHVHDWKAPGFSALWDGADSTKPAEEESPGPTDGDDYLKGIEFPSPEAVRQAGIETAEVCEKELAEYVTATGVLDYDRTRLAHLSPRVAGVVWRVDKQVGEKVRKGDVLALIEAAEVGKAKADFLQAYVQLDVRSKNLERMQSATAAMPERQLRDAEAAVREARVQRFNALQALANLGLPLRLDELNGLSDEQVARRLRLLGLPENVVRTLDPETTTANLLPLTAPFDGTVIGCDMVVGEAASVGQPHFTVADVSRLWALLDVRLEDAGRVAVGQVAVFRPDAAPGEKLCGRVAWISTEVDEKTRTVRVRAEADNGAGRFRAHTFGTGRIAVRTTPRAVVVPSEAVQWEGGSHLVFVLESEKVFRPRKVTLGLRDEHTCEVLAGLRPGEVVATTGSHVLKSEMLRSKIGGEE